MNDFPSNNLKESRLFEIIKGFFSNDVTNIDEMKLGGKLDFEVIFGSIC